MCRKVSPVLVLCILFVLPWSVGAQTPEPPDYFVVLRAIETSADSREGTVTFAISNIGGASSRVVDANLVDLRTGEVLVSQAVRPIVRADEVVEVSLSFDLGDFEPGIQLLRIEVGIGALNDANEANNYLPISLNISGAAQDAPGGQDAQPTATAPDEATPEPAVEQDAVPAPAVPLTVDGILARLGIDRSNPTLSAVVVGIALALAFAIVILLYILLIIVRLLFRRTPTFGAWQPPYANVPLYDPNTVAGRRQLWQQQATNNLIDAAAHERAVHCRKLLLGMDGGNLSGWRVTAIRLSQYDAYGRVARSQTLASSRLVRRANRMIRRMTRGNERAARGSARAIAKELTRAFRKKLNKRNAMLPIALDVRLQGVHGEVRILFELFQASGGMWLPIDRWEPEMTISGKTIYESMTYTLHGQLADEPRRAFHKRLRTSAATTLLNMGRLRDTTSASSSPQPNAQPSPQTGRRVESAITGKAGSAPPTPPSTPAVEHSHDEY